MTPFVQGMLETIPTGLSAVIETGSILLFIAFLVWVGKLMGEPDDGLIPHDSSFDSEEAEK